MSTKVYDSCKNVHAVAEVIAENIETVVVVNKLKRQHGRPSEIIVPEQQQQQRNSILTKVLKIS